MMHDLRYAFRTLLRTPLVTAVAVLSLALGIGANAGIYSLFDQLVRAPLPVADPGRLVNLGDPGPKMGRLSADDAGGSDEVFSYAMYRDLQREQKVLSGLAAYRSFGANLAVQGNTASGRAVAVSGSYFPVLGLRPGLGRLLGPADDDAFGAHPVAVLSDSYWRTRLGADPEVLQRTLIVNGQPFTIVGVAPRGFHGTTLGTSADVFVPITMMAQVSPQFGSFESRRNYWIYLFGRLKPGVRLAQARAALNTIYGRAIREVEAPELRGMSEQTMTRFRSMQLSVEPGGQGQSRMRGEVRTPMLLLLAITAFVLLIACANIANLLLARGTTRGVEMAVRLSLGANRGRIMRQLLTESLLLAALGGVASLLVASWTLSGIAAILPRDTVEALHLGLQPAAIVLAAVVALATGFLFGLFPALHATRPDLIRVIRDATGQVGGGRAAARFRTILVTAQIGLSMALLISAGLFIRSLVNVSRVDLGVRVEDVVTFGVSPERNGYDAGRSRALFQRIERDLRAAPGVRAVAASAVPLLASDNTTNNVSVQGFVGGPDVDANASLNEVGADYFRTLGEPLLGGREFTRGDVAGAPPVAVVNEAFVRKFGLGGGAVGAFMARGATDTLGIRIVGVVRDAKYSEVKDPVPAQYFTPYAQDSTLGALTFYVRSSLPTAQVARAIRAAVAAADPNLPVEALKTMPQQVDENIVLDRLITTLGAAFAALATLLAAIGLYGVLAYTVAQRMREFGVRMALGADARRLRRLVLRQVLGMALVGAAIGVGAALVIGRYAESLLYHMHARDPGVFLAAAALLGVVVFAGALAPALRASRVHPMQALRYE